MISGRSGYAESFDPTQSAIGPYLLICVNLRLSAVPCRGVALAETGG
ncbi:MAG: hypothetical protein O3C43_23625 [Verrucomicrobia bacterium]|nr:hypothetical protein [Verrucomicrobiota bacterium]